MGPPGAEEKDEVDPDAQMVADMLREAALIVVSPQVVSWAV